MSLSKRLDDEMHRQYPADEYEAAGYGEEWPSEQELTDDADHE